MPAMVAVGAVCGTAGLWYAAGHQGDRRGRTLLHSHGDDWVRRRVVVTRASRLAIGPWAVCSLVHSPFNERHIDRASTAAVSLLLHGGTLVVVAQTGVVA
jgi:hypothetical protein